MLRLLQQLRLLAPLTTSLHGCPEHMLYIQARLEGRAGGPQQGLQAGAAVQAGQQQGTEQQQQQVPPVQWRLLCVHVNTQAAEAVMQPMRKQLVALRESGTVGDGGTHGDTETAEWCPLSAVCCNDS